MKSHEHDDAIPIAPTTRSFGIVVDPDGPSSQLSASPLTNLNVDARRREIAKCAHRSEADASDRVTDVRGREHDPEDSR